MSKRKAEEFTTIDNDNKKHISENIALNSVTNTDGLDQKLKAAIDLLETGNVDENVINQYLSGFKEPGYQGIVNDTNKKNYLSARPDYVSKNTIQIDVILPEERGIIPSECRLELPITFYNDAKKTALAVDTLPVNAWPFYLIENVDIFRYGTVDPITPQRDISVHKYFFDEAKSIPKHIFEKVIKDFQFIPTPPTKSKRSKAANDEASRSDDNIAARKGKVAAFSERHKAKSIYKIPLKFLTNFGKINEIIRENLTFVFTLRRDMTQIFDRTDKSDGSNVVGYYEFHREPQLVCSYYSPTKFLTFYSNQLLSSIPTYTYGNTKTYTERIKEIPIGSKEVLLEFDTAGKQFDFIEISLQPRVSVDHTDQYASYNHEMAVSLIKKIAIRNLEKKVNIDQYNLDLTEELDKEIIYNNYLSYYANGPSSVSGLVDYINSPLLKDDLQDEDDYFAGYYPIYIDLRNSSGITELPDNIIRNDGKARVLITLKNTLASTYVLTCTGISTYASYRTVFKDGQKKIVFSTLHPAGNTTTTPAVPYRTNI